MKANRLEHTYQRTIINLDIIMNQTKVEGINNDYKEQLFNIVYKNPGLYSELIETIVNRDKMITKEFEELLKHEHTWEEITTEEYLNNIEYVSLTSAHKPHTWIYYAIKYKENTYIRMVQAQHQQIQTLVEIYDKGIKQLNQERERYLRTIWRAQKVQKNRLQGGSIDI